MAKVFPEKLPQEILNDPMRSSEVQVYNAFKSQLDDSYHVFYSSPWLGTNSDGSEIDGEADFLIAHADKGMLAVEVKGGRVKILSDNTWESKDRHGFTRRIKNPVTQALVSKHNILGKLKDSPLWTSRFICARHGVVLPHVTRPGRDFRPDMPLKLFAFEEDLGFLDAWVDARFGASEESDDRVKPLGMDGTHALEDMLTREISLRVKLGTSVHQDLGDIQLRTDDQIFILRGMEDNPRMAIAGAAGTGKTVLAIEKSVMLAEQGLRVLLLCFNRPLGQCLKQSLADYDNVTATHFHQFCSDIAGLANRNIDGVTADTLASQLIDNFVQAELEEYDAVIVDEGQDFRDEWLTSLEVVVRDGNRGVMYIFYDDNQKVTYSSANYISNMLLAKHHLTRNFRNTKCIFDEAAKHYLGRSVKTIGPFGRPSSFHPVTGENELKTRLAERIGSLMSAEGLRADEICVLFPNSASLNILRDARGVRIGQHRASDAEHRGDSLVADTIRRFKGLESPVVLLVLDAETAASEELLYTGITRAQAALEIFAPPHVLRQLDQSRDV